MTLPVLVKAALTPGSIAFLALCAVAWLVLRFVWPRTRLLAKAWAGLVVGLYLVLGLPVVATGIAERLPAVRAPGIVAGPGALVLVVLDGDNRVGRIQETLRVYRTAQPQAVVVLGEVWMLDELAVKGIPREKLSIDGGPATTRGQIAWLAARAQARPRERLAIVASRLQMPRVAALTRAAGLAPVFVSSPVDREPPTTGLWRLVPTYVALRTSRDALYEHAALWYYRWQGWIER